MSEIDNKELPIIESNDISDEVCEIEDEIVEEKEENTRDLPLQSSYNEQGFIVENPSMPEAWEEPDKPWKW